MLSLLPIVSALALSAQALTLGKAGDSCLVDAKVNADVLGFIFACADVRFVSLSLFYYPPSPSSQS